LVGEEFRSQGSGDQTLLAHALRWLLILELNLPGSALEIKQPLPLPGLEGLFEFAGQILAVLG
jgi:hypothetical protein